MTLWVENYYFLAKGLVIGEGECCNGDSLAGCD